MRLTVLVLALAALAGPALASPKIADLGWMVGAWVQSGEGSVVREVWLPASGDQMVGVSHETRAGRRPAYEFERIEDKDGVIAFTAILEGQPPTAFALRSAADGEVVFENKDHDFPQRVIYRRCGEDLCARIEGTIGGKTQGQDWRYRRDPAFAPR
jgi:hypothetical protein